MLEKLANFLTKNRKAVVGVSVAIVVVGLLIWTGFVVRDRAKSATVQIYVAPASATVLVGGEKYGTMQEGRIEPGEYAVEISAEGFKTKRGTIVAVAGEVSDVRVYLEPEEGNEDYYNEHPGDALVVGEIRAAETSAALAELTAREPVLGALPIEIDFYTNGYAKRVRYTISYRVAEDYTGFVLVVTDYTGGNYEAALEKLRARGFQPEDYEIEYVDATDDGLGVRAE